MKNIVTPMNFIRGSEPRLPMDLLGTTKNLLELTQKYAIKTTYLLQYDAFMKKEYQELFVKENPLIEVGLWLELCQDLIEKVGLVWRGRYDWDYYLEVDNLLGYKDEEKFLIIDEIFRAYKETFGDYPKTVASWLLDPYSLDYIVKKYGIVCHAICREQWGTDGITLFGGYYNQAYYPSRNNILCPADKEKGVPVPTFRLLGCDPIYQYDGQLTSTCGDVFTLEPVYWTDEKTGKPSPIGGNNPQWIRWYFDSLYRQKHGLSFAYAQVGQENSFGWERIHEGLMAQLDELKKLIAQGEVEPMFMKEAGEWFAENFEKSPPSTQVALCDYENKPIKSVWYYCQNYRINLYADEEGVRVRDMFLCDEGYKARYGGDVLLTTHDAIHDNLPIMNGLLWTKLPHRAGIYFCDGEGNRIVLDDFRYEEKAGTATATLVYAGGEIAVRLCESGVRISSKENFSLHFDYVETLTEEKIAVQDEKT
ncbi:MAG: hypothetical protein IJX18_01310, partial [Clostridia bacterium]|nr:hypothetical protein [Clostridia bacterium]